MTADAEREKFEGLFRELGRFVYEFANVEVHLVVTARVLTYAPAQFLLDIVDSWRVDRGVTAIRNLLKTLQYPEDLKCDLRTALEHLKEVSNLRNALLHATTTSVPDPELAGFLGKPADFDFGGSDFVTTNVLHARSDEALRVYPVSAEILRSAYDDLRWIMRYLRLCEEQILDARYPQQRTPRPEAKEEIKELREQSWSWKAPQQAGWKFAKPSS